jgi:hypothetical protein
MKISFGAVAAFVLASAFLQTAGYAQAPPRGSPIFKFQCRKYLGLARRPGEQNYDRERWEHCERLRDREHDLRDRLAYAPPYGEDRARLEHRLREVHYQREQCRCR